MSKHYLEIDNASLQAKLNVALKLLRKAQLVIKARKSEVALLKAELLRKNALLHDEMLAHEATNHKLAKTMQRLNQKFSHTVISSDREFMAQLAYLEQLP